MRNGRLAPLFGAFLLIAGCAAPGDTIDKWFGPGPVQKPNELVNFKHVVRTCVGNLQLTKLSVMHSSSLIMHI